MRIVRLSSSESSFRELRFREKGVSLILGDGEHVAGRQDGDSNGVGKTLALRLIHHCLGADKPPPALASVAAEWWFYLDVRIGGRDFRIARKGDGSKIALNEKEIRIKPFREWLNQYGGFESDVHSFRSLFPRFARRSQEDSASPVALEKELPHEALQRTLYLLNVDEVLSRRKVELKERLDALKDEVKLLKKSSIFRDVFKAGQRPESRLKELGAESDILRANLQSFEVSEDYRNIEDQANQLTSELRAISEEIHLLKFELDGVKDAQQRRVDITRNDLLSLYEGLGQIFRPEALRHFQQVEDFQKALVSNREHRLMKDEIRIREEIDNLEASESSKSTARAMLLQHIAGKRALDEYVSLTMKLAGLEEERKRLQSFVDLEKDKAKELQIVKSAMVYQDELALRYSQSDPLDDLDGKYRSIVQRLYPDSSAGITLKNNSGENKVRFNLDVSVQGQDSDGIANARIICFDWLLFKHGREHNMDFLWHDNRLFADMDPKPRASWFSFISETFMKEDRQYIATLNYENFHSMAPFLHDSIRGMLENSVIVTLKGDRDANRLMGVKFG